ncbi:MAG: SDR family oxidoreductase [Rhodospirillaceae bacterium]|jgi:NAD(P)-dependent dehydrogenase (short-subunit alcohol dehydrogenase family)|nr:SDR family oxidoreductase [Rhodospirillaceae bacterium]MBT5240625.1 SDR family oxidoreductase [Rhodospirillaceae bacterium]MBT5564460.1 SDR family oxidoreductase [Rhodospirillaceae bacterium]MBT6089750.1 SDR family oxidoreductase [Rhodospirillaceae bacterium]MBT6959625.1 SDR family oxidoreductase [Rhodospirillaceae bacterium]
MRFAIFAAAFVSIFSSLIANAATVLITGSNRGIGLEFAKQYSELGWTVIATSRTPNDDDELNALDAQYDNLRVIALDVSDFDAIDALAAELEGTPIDVLLNNAGILGGGTDVQTIGNIDFESMERVYKTNAMAPMKMAEAFLEHVAASDQKKIGVITSGTASLANVRQSPFFQSLYLYRMSKTAINMGYRALAVELADRGIWVGILAPGMVNTRLLEQAGAGGRGISTEQSVTAVIRNIENLGPETTGQYIIYTGDTLPW